MEAGPSMPAGLASFTHVVVDSTGPCDVHDWEWEEEIKGEVCQTCGKVSEDHSTQGLELLGAQKDEGEWVGGRQHLHEAGAQLSQLRPSIQGHHVKGAIVDFKAEHARRRLHAYDIFIKQILIALDMPGLKDSVRSTFLKAKNGLELNWGRKSKDAALVAVYVNARLTKRKVSLSELATLGEVKIERVLKMYNLIQKKFEIPVVAKDPAIQAERALEHCQAIAADPNPILHGLHRDKFSAQGLKFLRSLDWTKVAKMADAILTYVNNLKLVANRASEPVGCSIAQLAMEGVMRTSYPFITEIQAELAHFCSVGAYTVAERYRELVRALRASADQVPFLKLVKRETKPQLALHIDDIVTFCNARAQKDFAPLTLDKTTRYLIDQEDETDPTKRASPPSDLAFGVADSPLDETGDVLAAAFEKVQGSKKRPARHTRPIPQFVKRARTIEQAAIDLLSSSALGANGSGSISSRTGTPQSLDRLDSEPLTGSQIKEGESKGFAAHNPETVNVRRLLLAGVDPTAIFTSKSGPDPLAEYDLTRSSSTPDGRCSDGLKNGSTSKRLKKLLWQKPAELITDEELFEPGELDSYLYNDDELETLRRLPKFQELTAQGAAEKRLPELGDLPPTNVEVPAASTSASSPTKRSSFIVRERIIDPSSGELVGSASASSATQRRPMNSTINGADKGGGEGDDAAETDVTEMEVVHEEATMRVVDVFVNGKRTKLHPTANATLQRMFGATFDAATMLDLDDDDDDVAASLRLQRGKEREEEDDDDGGGGEGEGEGGGDGEDDKGRKGRRNKGKGRQVSPSKAQGRARRWSSSVDDGFSDRADASSDSADEGDMVVEPEPESADN